MFKKVKVFIENHMTEITLAGLGIVALSMFRSAIRSDVEKVISNHAVRVDLNTDDVNRLLLQINNKEEA